MEGGGGGGFGLFLSSLCNLRVRAPLPEHRARLPLVVPDQPVVDGLLLLVQPGVVRAQLPEAPGAEQRRLHEHVGALPDVGGREHPVALEGRLRHRDVLVGKAAVGQGVARAPALPEARVDRAREVLPPFGGRGRRIPLVLVVPKCVRGWLV